MKQNNPRDTSPLARSILDAGAELAALKEASDLVGRLDERCGLYRGRGTRESDWIRALIFLRLCEAGVVHELLPFLTEELQTGSEPITVAAAARAACEAPYFWPELPYAVDAAVERFRLFDCSIDFAKLDTNYSSLPQTTLSAELYRLQQRLASVTNASERCENSLSTCCPEPANTLTRCYDPWQSSVSDVLATVDEAFWEVMLQDQGGERMTFRSLLIGRPSVLAFFYTRCMNPDKCSLTITKLAQLQRRLETDGWTGACNIVGMTYDPAYDTRQRLRQFGTDRGLQFDQTTRLVRCTGSMTDVINALTLRVGYGPSTVNRHAVELILLDHNGHPIFASRRQMWDVQEVCDRLIALSGA